jgi:hypothetical protein
VSWKLFHRSCGDDFFSGPSQWKVGGMGWARIPSGATLTQKISWLDKLPRLAVNPRFCSNTSHSLPSWDSGREGSAQIPSAGRCTRAGTVSRVTSQTTVALPVLTRTHRAKPDPTCQRVRPDQLDCVENLEGQGRSQEKRSPGSKWTCRKKIYLYSSHV